MASETLIVDFNEPGTAARVRFFTDQVMGGVSTGEARVEDGALTLEGRVSTENNGGFIQARLSNIRLPGQTARLRLDVKGDGQVYYIHLRSRATRLPWQYYQATFRTNGDWQDIAIGLEAFTPSGRLLPRTVRPETVTSIALVAYGRDHDAAVSLARIRAD